MNIPEPCQRCQTMRKHECKMQPICTRVKAYYRCAVGYQMDGQAVDRARRLQKLHSRKYKGGVM